MMTAVDGRKPDAEQYTAIKNARRPAALRFDAVIQDHEEVGGMKGWHRRKNIGALAVDTGKNRDPEKCVEPGQAGGIAGCRGNEFKSFLRHVPGRRSRVRIVTDKPDQVDQQKGQGELEKKVGGS